MAVSPDQAAAQSADQVHAAATQASAALNKLAQLLKAAGADKSAVAQVDQMANDTNDIASAAVGNTGPPPDQGVAPPPDQGPGLQGATEGLHADMQAAAA